MNACRSVAPLAFMIQGQNSSYWETLDIKSLQEVAPFSENRRIRLRARLRRFCSQFVSSTRLFQRAVNNAQS